MIYLNVGLFKPSVILISIIFLPITIACAVAVCFKFQVILLVTFSTSLLFYCAAMLWAYKASKSQKDQLCIHNDCITIKSRNLCNKAQELSLHRSQIVKMEFYKISSIRAWCLLFNYVLPQCVFVTYVCNGTETCQLIGYPNRTQISNLCRSLGVAFIEK